jgi:hypothetical protein
MNHDSSDNPNPEDPKWLEEIQDLANEVLGSAENGSACEQVHPIIARWYDETLMKMEEEPLEDRSAVWQAVSCLATEIMMDAEFDESLEPLFETIDEDMLGMWIEQILLIGRAMEASLRDGDLDDL